MARVHAYVPSRPGEMAWHATFPRKVAAMCACRPWVRCHLIQERLQVWYTWTYMLINCLAWMGLILCSHLMGVPQPEGIDTTYKSLDIEPPLQINFQKSQKKKKKNGSVFHFCSLWIFPKTCFPFFFSFSWRNLLWWQCLVWNKTSLHHLQAEPQIVFW